MAAVYQPAGFINNAFSRDPEYRRRSKPRRVERAHIKNRLKTIQQQQEEEEAHRLSGAKTREPSLIDRFFALPAEIRNHIYRILLVQPCKWDMRHLHYQKCTPITFDYPGPRTNYVPPSSSVYYVCAACCCPGYLWRGDTEVLVSPLRSAWTPPPTNPFMCDNCYSEKVRRKRELHPSLKLVKCLCVRRENLHIMLINKRFYDEAAPVFWTENMFAFENPVILGDFLESIRPQTRDLIRMISVVENAEGGSLVPWRSRDLFRAIYWLRQCRGLTEVELDDYFLSKWTWAFRVKNIMPKNRVRFIQYKHPREAAYLGYYCPPVWKVLYCREDSDDPLAQKLAVSMARHKPLTNRAIRAL